MRIKFDRITTENNIEICFSDKELSELSELKLPLRLAALDSMMELGAELSRLPE